MSMRFQSISDLQEALSKFAADREWDQFHSPKNLAMAIGAEAGELLELFRWTTESQSAQLDAETRRAVESELADIMIFLARIADKVDVDLLEAASRKIESNAARYPAQLVRGSPAKRK